MVKQVRPLDYKEEDTKDQFLARIEKAIEIINNIDYDFSKIQELASW